MFKSKKLQKPKERGFYAWNKLRAGDFLIFLESINKHHEFLYIPGGDFFRLSEQDFDKLISTNHLSIVEQLPKNVFEETLCWAKKNVALSTTRSECYIDE